MLKKFSYYLTFIIFAICCCFPVLAMADVKLEAVYPYSLEQKKIDVVTGGSTMPLYINLQTFDIPQEQKVTFEVELPEHFMSLAENGWQQQGNVARKEVLIPANYDQSFTLLYLQPMEEAVSGKITIKVSALGENFQEFKTIDFTYAAEHITQKAQEKAVVKKSVLKKKFNWYIQSVTIPVDNQGKKDDRASDNTLYIKDLALEGFRNRLVGEGTTNWGAVFNHPACHLLLEMRNPQKDIRILKFKAELIDRGTNQVVPGLCTAGRNNDETEQGWSAQENHSNAAVAMISLDGNKNQTFVLPIYVDYFQVVEGDYNIRVTVSGNGQEKIQEVPLTITQKNNIGISVVIFAACCLLFVLICMPKIYRTIRVVGAKGAITIALFAAIAFAGIVLPTTLLGELLHVFLGPFSGLISGILSGLFQYLLMISLLVLYRQLGVLALMLIIKFLLSGLLLGHFTPVGMLSCAVYIVILEGTLFFSGFYKQKQLSTHYMLFIAVLLGLADAAITFINLEQLMFFYRLYYADWYIGLYMIVNGFIYSGIGSYLGYRVGVKLEQVTGE